MRDSCSFISNSNIMFILCLSAIIFVMIQAIIFFRMAWKRAVQLGFKTKDLKKVVKSSAVFSIIPSLPIIISYMLLLPVLGKFFPWLRLSVIGSAAYETMAANMAATSYGFESFSNAKLTPDVFGCIMWTVTLGMLLSSLSVVILKRYDKKMQQISTRESGFGKLVGPIMFLGLMATFSATFIVDYKNIIGIATIIVSAGAVLLLNKLAKKYPVVKEFSFSISMIAGMAAACILTYFNT